MAKALSSLRSTFGIADESSSHNAGFWESLEENTTLSRTNVHPFPQCPREITPQDPPTPPCSLEILWIHLLPRTRNLILFHRTRLTESREKLERKGAM